MLLYRECGYVAPCIRGKVIFSAFSVTDLATRIMFIIDLQEIKQLKRTSAEFKNYLAGKIKNPERKFSDDFSLKFELQYSFYSFEIQCYDFILNVTHTWPRWRKSLKKYHASYVVKHGCLLFHAKSQLILWICSYLDWRRTKLRLFMYYESERCWPMFISRKRI